MTFKAFRNLFSKLSMLTAGLVVLFLMGESPIEIVKYATFGIIAISISMQIVRLLRRAAESFEALQPTVEIADDDNWEIIDDDS